MNKEEFYAITLAASQHVLRREIETINGRTRFVKDLGAYVLTFFEIVATIEQQVFSVGDSNIIDLYRRIDDPTVDDVYHLFYP